MIFIVSSQVAIYQETFDAFDVDGGGSIDTAELKVLLNAFGMVTIDPSPRSMQQHARSS